MSALLRELIAALETGEQPRDPARAALLGELILDELARTLAPDPRAAWLTGRAPPGRPSAPGAPFRARAGHGFRPVAPLGALAHDASLTTRGLPLWQVAEQLGYASQSAFTAMFRKTFGTTPSAFFANARGQ